MLRPSLVGRTSHTLLRRYLTGGTDLPPRYESLATADVPEAKEWLKSFGAAKLERADVDLSFARSSGPGGQVRGLGPSSMKGRNAEEYQLLAECQ